jgi:hypothetical protein
MNKSKDWRAKHADADEIYDFLFGLREFQSLPYKTIPYMNDLRNQYRAREFLSDAQVESLRGMIRKLKDDPLSRPNISSPSAADRAAEARNSSTDEFNTHEKNSRSPQLGFFGQKTFPF